LDATLENLIALHHCDSAIKQLQKKCSEIPLMIQNLEKEMEAYTLAIDSIKNGIKTGEKRAKENESGIEDSRQQQGKYRAQLFKLKSNREYQALTAEIEILDKKISELETGILELFEENDHNREKLKKLQSEFKLKEIGIIEEKKKLNDDLRHELTKFRTEEKIRSEIVNKINPEVVAKYSRILKKHHSAVAAIVNGNCGGCFVKVRPQLSALVRGNDQILNCEDCGRFLYWSDVSE
jgi:uncharacterized protein